MAPIDTWLELAAGKRLHPNRPSVTLAYAQSLDGSIAFRRGQPAALSGPESTRLTHKLRSAHDSILVGIGTVLSDDPLLTTRIPGNNHPQPVILDTHLRTPLNARIISHNPKSVWIACCDPVDPARRAAFESKSARLLTLPADPTGVVSLPALLDILGDLGIRRLMVEGGAKVISSFLAQGLVDLVAITLAPFFMGGYHAVEAGSLRGSGIGSLPRLKNLEFERLGEDWVIWGTLR